MIATWSVGAAGEYLAAGELAEHAVLVRRHPWWRARAMLTGALLDQLGVRPPSRVLDAGCGWGVTFRSLERRGYRVAGLDVFPGRAGRSLPAEKPPGFSPSGVSQRLPPPAPLARSAGPESTFRVGAAPRALAGRLKVGTSLFAVARQPW